MLDAAGWRQMTQEDLGTLGVNEVAYIAPVQAGEARAFAVNAADGTRITVVPDRQSAVAAALHYNLQPLPIH